MSLKFRIVTRLEGLQNHLGDALAVVADYDVLLTAATDPKEKLKIRHHVANLAGLVEGYKREFLELAERLQQEGEADFRTDRLVKDLNERFGRFERLSSALTAL